MVNTKSCIIDSGPIVRQKEGEEWWRNARPCPIIDSGPIVRQKEGEEYLSTHTIDDGPTKNK